MQDNYYIDMCKLRLDISSDILYLGPMNLSDGSVLLTYAINFIDIGSTMQLK